MQTFSKRVGSMRTTDQEKREYAKKSHEWNIAQPKFRTIFPEYAEKEEKSVPNMSGSSDVAKKDEGEKVSSSLSYPLRDNLED